MTRFNVFNIVPGDSCWPDMPDRYKDAYYQSIKKEEPKEEIVLEPETEKLVIEVVEEEVIELVDEIKKTCPTCGKEVPESKTYCDRACYLNRNK